MTDTLADVAKRWQQRATSNPEYKVVANDNVFRMGMYPSSIGKTKYDELSRLLDDLLERYDGCPITEVLSGVEVENSDGKYLKIVNSEPCPKDLLLSSSPIPNLDRELSLVKGIGIKRMKQLKMRGIQKISDLTQIRRYSEDARRLLDIFGVSSGLCSDPDTLYLEIKKRAGVSHPLTTLCTSGINRENFRFIDIETMGLFGRPVILIGIAQISQDQLISTQYLIRSISEECAVLTAVNEALSDACVLVSFNGRSFDLPYIQDRMCYYGLPLLPEMLHIDLLHPSRRMWKKEYHDCRLSTLEEKYLGVNRQVDIPGMLVPGWYQVYLKKENPGPLVPIVAHNRQDIISLAYLLDLLRRSA